jgi:uncharacterized phage protein (TIGR01671 family)
MREIKFKFFNKIKKEMWLIESINWQTKEISNGSHIANIDDGVLFQFTGLKDKNGKEIFENDIVCWTLNDKLKSQIVFHEGCFGHLNLTGINKEHSEFIPINKVRAEYMIVCGNIYENPELLTKKG